MKNDENLIPKQTENLENNEIHETIQSDFLKNVSGPSESTEKRKNRCQPCYGLRLLRDRQNDF